VVEQFKKNSASRHRSRRLRHLSRIACVPSHVYAVCISE